MPDVPDFNTRPLKPIRRTLYPNAPASYRQKNLIITMCEQRKINVPDLSKLTKAEASEIITAIMDSKEST